jgi:hypothetical protein
LTSDLNEPRTGKKGVRWEVVFAVGIVVLACAVLACVMGAALFVFINRSGSLPDIEPLPATPTQEIALPATPTQEATLRPPTATPSPFPQATATATVMATASPTQEAAAPPTPTPTLAMPVPVTPTPVVCNDLTALGRITLAPGQAFVCTIDEQQLTEQLDARPENPCADTNVAFRDDGRVYVTCRMGLTMRATGVVEVDDCRMDLRIISGTFGFAQLIQGLIDQNEAFMPYNRICIDDAEVSEGQITVWGHGR